MTYAVFVSTSEPAAFVAVNDTSNVPGESYTTVGFCCVDDDGVPPSNDHSHSVGAFDDKSVKLTLPPATTDTESAEKSATGASADGVPDSKSSIVLMPATLIAWTYTRVRNTVRETGDRAGRVGRQPVAREADATLCCGHPVQRDRALRHRTPTATTSPPANRCRARSM